MAKKTVQMIRVTMIGYIPAADILDRDSIEKQFTTLNEIRQFGHDKMHDMDFRQRSVGRLIEDTSATDDSGEVGDVDE